MRALAALYVALYHTVQPFTRWGSLTPLMSAGYVSVSFFFMLSGFILTYTSGLAFAEGRGYPQILGGRFARGRAPRETAGAAMVERPQTESDGWRLGPFYAMFMEKSGVAATSAWV